MTEKHLHPSQFDELLAQLHAIQTTMITPLEITLANTICTIGRSPSCHIVVRHARVSRLHARIERQGLRFIINDAGSANGTYLNGTRLLAGRILANNDTIGLGSAEPVLRFVDLDSTEHTSGVLRYDEQTMLFYLSGTRVELTPMQFRLLRHLYQYAGEMCSRESCAQAIWGRDYESGMDAGALDQAMNSLRRTLRAIDAEANPIETRRGLGYVLHI